MPRLVALERNSVQVIPLQMIPCTSYIAGVVNGEDEDEDGSLSLPPFRPPLMCSHVAVDIYLPFNYNASRQCPSNRNL